MKTTRYIPGQEYAMATVDQIDARIAHLTWILAPGRYRGSDRGNLAVELDMLRGQWLGNAQVRARQAA